MRQKSICSEKYLQKAVTSKSFFSGYEWKSDRKTEESRGRACRVKPAAGARPESKALPGGELPSAPHREFPPALRRQSGHLLVPCAYGKQVIPRAAPHDRNTALPRCSSRPHRNPLKSNPATGTPALSHGGAPIPQREGQTRTGARSACTRASSCSSPHPRFPSTRNAPSDTGSECGGLLPEQSDPAPAAAGDPKGRKRRRKAKPLSPRKIEPFKVCAIAGTGKFQPIACQNTGQRRLRGAFRKKPPYA